MKKNIPTILLSLLIFGGCQYLIIEFIFSCSAIKGPAALLCSYVFVTWFSVLYIYINCKLASRKCEETEGNLRRRATDAPSVEENSARLAKKFGPLGELKTEPKDFS